MDYSTDLTTFISEYIKKELGIIYSTVNNYQLKSRLEEVAKVLGCESVQSFCDELKKGLIETRKQAFLDIVTNNETSFFRDKNVFEVVKNDILPSLASKGAAPIKIWCAASSYGQEPSTLSMIISELQEESTQFSSCAIEATDVSRRVLDRAETGRYSQLEVQRGLPAKTMLKYFEDDGEGWWKLNGKERSRIKYNYRNLQKPFDKIGLFDIVFCRNVLIYQSIEGKKDIIERIHNQIKPGGYFVLGAGESLIGLSKRFELKKNGNVIFYQKNEAA